MAKQTYLYLTKSIKTPVARIQPADTTNYVTIFSAGTDDSYIESLIATSDDSSARIVVVSIFDGSNNYPILAVNIPAGSGTDGTNAAVDLLNYQSGAGLPLNANGKRYIKLASGYSLKAKVTTTMTTAKTMYITGQGEDF